MSFCSQGVGDLNLGERGQHPGGEGSESGVRGVCILEGSVSMGRVSVSGGGQLPPPSSNI